MTFPHKNDLSTILREVREGLDHEQQESFRRDVSLLYENGVRSYDDMLACLRNRCAPSEIRRIIYWVLGRMHDDRVPQVLVDSMYAETDSEAIWEIAKSLSDKAIAGLVSVRPLVSLATHSEHATKRAAVAYVLGRVVDEMATECLLRFLSNHEEDEGVRTHAAESLGLLKDRRAVDALLAALNDSSPSVRFWSAYALGEIGDPRAVPALRRLADSDDSEIEGWGSLKEEALEAIHRIESAAESL